MSPIPSASFSFTIVTPPAHGQLTGSGANRSYQPDPDFNGSDSFTFKANDGSRDSNTSTITITTTEVNDVPLATDDAASTDEDTQLQITASDLATNDSAGPANENLQVLTVTNVSATGDTHGSVSLSTGTITYSPDTNYNGPASFTYQVCDNGTTNGAPDAKCTTGTVNVTVTAVNDPPTLNAIANQTVYVGNTLNLTAVGSDLDLPPQTLTYSLTGSVPSGAMINPTTGAFSWAPTAAQGGHIYTLTVRVTDDGSPNLYAEQQFSVGVAWTWSNLLAPVQAGGTYKAGRTIPIKFQLTGASAGITDAVIRLYVFQVNNNVVGDAVDVQSTSAATTDNLFHYVQRGVCLQSQYGGHATRDLPIADRHGRRCLTCRKHLPPVTGRQTDCRVQCISERTVGAALRGRPCVLNRVRKAWAVLLEAGELKPRAATEGRPYSSVNGPKPTFLLSILASMGHRNRHFLPAKRPIRSAYVTDCSSP